MTWNDFLASAAGQSAWTVVGPCFLGQAHRPTRPTLYVDGGFDFYEAAPDAKGPPIFALGDGDSLRQPKPLDERLPQEKDFSDLQAALAKVPDSVTRLELLGFLGCRRDHEWIGLGEVYRWLKKGGRQVRFDQGEVLGFASGPTRLTIQGLFSIVGLEPSVLSITGSCRYPLTPAREVPVLSSQLLSNFGLGEIQVDSNQPWFLFKN